MSYHNDQQGFTIVEILVVIVLIGIASIGLITFVNNSSRQYLGLQKDATAFSDLSQQSHRITNVLRGATDITEAGDETITVYAYFFPNAQYVSQVKYYLNAGKTVLYADVTPMTSNPPIGTPITAQKKTYTIIPYYYQAAGVKLFEYQDSVGNNLTLPITQLSTVKGIRINLRTPSNGLSNNASQSVSTQVSLRNRKTNL